MAKVVKKVVKKKDDEVLEEKTTIKNNIKVEPVEEGDFVITPVENKEVTRNINVDGCNMLIMDTFNIMGENPIQSSNSVRNRGELSTLPDAVNSILDRVPKLQDILLKGRDMLQETPRGSNIIVGVDPFSIESLGQQVFGEVNTKRILTQELYSKDQENVTRKEMNIMFDLLSNYTEDELNEIRKFGDINKKDAIKEGKEYYKDVYIPNKEKYTCLEKIDEYGITLEGLEDNMYFFGDHIDWFIQARKGKKWYFKLDQEVEKFFSGELDDYVINGKPTSETKEKLAKDLLDRYAKKGDTILLVNNQEDSILEKVILEQGYHLVKLDFKGGAI